jgi:hypothetical protein
MLVRILLPVLLVAGLALPASARDRGADGKFETRSSSHFLLHQDVDIDQSGGFHGSRRFEQQVLASLEEAYEQLDRLLGLRPERKLDVLVYDPALFDREFGALFRFQAAGFYAGIIRIRGGTDLSVPLQRVLRHELVHAALDAEAPSLVLPAWINEGGAEWFEARSLGKRGLSQREWGALQHWSANSALFSLAQLSLPAFSRMSGDQAQIAYVQSYAIIEMLARTHGERSLRRFYRELIRSRDVARSLKRVYRLDLRSLEAQFFEQLR